MQKQECQTLTDVQSDIENYLVEQLDEEGKLYFKSKFIARDLDLSAKKVGINIGLLKERTETLVIEKYMGQSSGTTWKVERNGGEGASFTANMVPSDD